MADELSPRGPHYSLRPVVMSAGAIVVAGSPFAAHAGAEILSAGGNAVDAAIAAAAVQAVVLPHLNGLGGDMFMLHRSAAGKIAALNASGPAPAGASPSAFRRRGLSSIPVRGIEAAAVPGAVEGWFRALRELGTLPPASVFERALEYAENGFPAYANLVSYLLTPAFKAAVATEPRLGELYLKDGRPPRKGERLQQPMLAWALRRLVRYGADDFYRGEIADLIIRTSEQRSGFFEKEDLATYRSRWVEPISVTYNGIEVFQVPPNSQGITMLQQLLLLDDYELRSLGHNSPEYIDLLVRAKIAAFADRAAFVADPDVVEVPIERMLSAERAATFRREVDPVAHPSHNNSGAVRSGIGDTVSCVVIDHAGNAVSLIQSLFEDFGSAVFVENAGFVLNNRVCGFTLQEDHPNLLAPKKRPLHTLCCSIVTDRSRRVLAYATPGGHAQTQTLVQVLNNVILFDMDVQEAVEAPRFTHERDELLLESRIDPSTASALARSGYSVGRLPAWSSVVGGCTAVLIDTLTGIRQGGADPRRDAYAVASR